MEIIYDRQKWENLLMESLSKLGLINQEFYGFIKLHISKGGLSDIDRGRYITKNMYEVEKSLKRRKQ